MTDVPKTPATGIDPRSPRFGAAITAVLLLIDLFLALTGATVAAAVLLLLIAALFAWGAFAGVRRHPYGLLYRVAVRPGWRRRPSWRTRPRRRSRRPSGSSSPGSACSCSCSACPPRCRSRPRWRSSRPS